MIPTFPKISSTLCFSKSISWYLKISCITTPKIRRLNTVGKFVFLLKVSNIVDNITTVHNIISMLNIFIEFSSFIIYIEQNIHSPCSLLKNTIPLQVLDCIDRVGDNPFEAVIK
jgi:hypothetical protein